MKLIICKFTACVALLGLVFSQSACNPATLNDILNKVTFILNAADGIIKIISGLNLGNSAQDLADAQKADEYVLQLTEAAKQAVAEANSKDSNPVKFSTIFGIFAPYDKLPEIKNQQIGGAVQATVALVEALLGQLKVNGAQAPQSVVASVPAVKTEPNGFALPGQLKFKLERVYDHAASTHEKALVLSTAIVH